MRSVDGAEVAHQPAHRLREAERRDEGDAGAPAEVALVGEQRVLRDRLAGAVPGDDVQRDRRAAGAPTLPAIASALSLVTAPCTLPSAERELVRDRAEVLDAERVLDDRVDVGVLQEQRALAEPLEGMAERPQVLAVAVGDGARPRRARGRRSRSRPRRRRPGAARPAGSRRRGPRAPRTAAVRARRAASLTSAAARPVRPLDASGACRAGARRAAGARSCRAAAGGCGGRSRIISSIGVASATSLPYSPSPSEIAPALRPSQ